MDSPSDSVDRPMRAGGEPPAHVFISHHSSQHAAARKVKLALADAGLFGWIAPDDVDPGSAFDTQILEEIRRAGVVVLLLCEQSDKSRHVKREIMLAEDAGKAVIPVRLTQVQSEGLAYWLKDSQWIDWFDARGEGLERLVKAVAERVGAPPPDAVTPLPATLARKQRRLAVLAALALGGGGWYLWERMTEPAAMVRPGLWLSKREMLAVTFPENLPKDAIDQIRASVETDPNPEECLTDEVVRHPDVKLFDPGNKGKCVLSAFDVGDGQMSGYLNCPMVGVKDGTVAITFRGTYTDTNIVIDQEIAMFQPSGALRFKARESSRWLAGECRAGARRD